MNLENAIAANLKKVSSEFTRAKLRAIRAREDRVSQWQIDRWNKQNEELALKEAAYEVIEQCYKAVSDNGKLPANKRQIYYDVRPLVIERTGRSWNDSGKAFTQNVLPAFLRDYPDLTASWDIVADARGHFSEPHVRNRIGIGTLEVRGYVNSWETKPEPTIEIDDTYPTRGPRNRYKFALFVEKEGFGPLLERAMIEQRYDLAIFSSKGQTSEATRQLADELSAAGVIILVAHDFDKAGISIAHWLWHDNERYQFRNKLRVIDIGLRLADVNRLGLKSEEQIHHQRKDPTEQFLEWDDDLVSEEERNFLKGRFSYSAGERGGWIGQRVELNAMTSAQFIRWLESKLDEAGVQKVVPGLDTLTQAWQRAVRISKARALIEQVGATQVATPSDLEAKVRAILKHSPRLSWDTALAQIAAKHLKEKPLLLKSGGRANAK